MKTCIGCKQELPESRFYISNRPARYGRQARREVASRCKQCCTATEKDRYKANAPAVIARVQARTDKAEKSSYDKKYRLRKYGLNVADYEAMLDAQGHRCAACRDEFQERGAKRPHIDHCHDTGVVRGVLCHACNVALGMLEDDAMRVSALLAYLDPC